MSGDRQSISSEEQALEVIGEVAAKSFLEYEEAIRTLAEDQVNVRIPNGKPEHAIILFKYLFLHAKKSVQIFSGSLNRAVYGDARVLDAVVEYLLRNKAKLEILVQDPSDLKDHPLIATAKLLDELDVLKGEFSLRVAKGQYSNPETSKHFCVSDSESYRFEHEEGVDEEGKFVCKATANFNEPNLAKKLASAFSTAFSSAEKDLIALKATAA